LILPDTNVVASNPLDIAAFSTFPEDPKVLTFVIEIGSYVMVATFPVTGIDSCLATGDNPPSAPKKIASISSSAPDAAMDS